MIDTRYCVKTQEEIDKILEEVKRIYIHYLQKEHMEKYEKENSG